MCYFYLLINQLDHQAKQLLNLSHHIPDPIVNKSPVCMNKDHVPIRSDQYKYIYVRMYIFIHIHRVTYIHMYRAINFIQNILEKIVQEVQRRYIHTYICILVHYTCVLTGFGKIRHLHTKKHLEIHNLFIQSEKACSFLEVYSYLQLNGYPLYSAQLAAFPAILDRFLSTPQALIYRIFGWRVAGNHEVGVTEKLSNFQGEMVQIKGLLHMSQYYIDKFMAYIIKKLGDDFQQGGCMYKPTSGFHQWSSEYLWMSDRPQKQASENADHVVKSLAVML